MDRLAGKFHGLVDVDVDVDDDEERGLWLPVQEWQRELAPGWSKAMVGVAVGSME